MKGSSDRLLRDARVMAPARGFNGAADVALSGEAVIASETLRAVFRLHAARRIEVESPRTPSPALLAA
jgi:hypothetical protein